MRRLFLAAIVAATVLAACTSPPPPQRDPFGNTLAIAITRAFNAKGSVKIANVTPFQWQRFYAFKPASSPDQINGTLGFTWAKDYSDQTDTYCLLVFVSGTTVVHSLLFPRYQGDCKTIETGPYTPASAVFTVTTTGKTTGGAPFLQLHTGS
ncbi:MAG TPA: hypothetical protein VJ818_05945 [Actinomycetota bacterium]|nr:hypothetical protein [Actinomycetota bacterium]